MLTSLNHQPTDDVPILYMGDYVEYDHVDDMDNSGIPQPAHIAHSGRHRGPHPSDGSGMEVPMLKTFHSFSRNLWDGNGVPAMV
jgi:hypothetical protein